MSVHIGLQSESESGELITTFNGGESIELEIFHKDLSKTVCLQFIDPYGETIFNQLQIPVLVEELDHLMQQSQSSKFVRNIELMLRFLEKTKEVHVHVRFIGD